MAVAAAVVTVTEAAARNLSRARGDPPFLTFTPLPEQPARLEGWLRSAPSPRRLFARLTRMELQILRGHRRRHRFSRKDSAFSAGECTPHLSAGPGGHRQSRLPLSRGRSRRRTVVVAVVATVAALAAAFAAAFAATAAAAYPDSRRLPSRRRNGRTEKSGRSKTVEGGVAPTTRLGRCLRLRGCRRRRWDHRRRCPRRTAAAAAPPVPHLDARRRPTLLPPCPHLPGRWVRQLCWWQLAGGRDPELQPLLQSLLQASLQALLEACRRYLGRRSLPQSRERPLLQPPTSAATYAETPGQYQR